MSSTKTDILAKFKRTIVELLDDLLDQFPNDASLVMARVIMDKPIPMQEPMAQFVAAVLPIREMVRTRDEQFFLKQSSASVIFGGLRDRDVDKFKTLWQTLDAENREVVWQYFDCFVALASKYAAC